MWDALRDEVARWVELGAGLDEIEAGLIEPAQGLGEDKRAALALFAWSYAAPTAEIEQCSSHPIVVRETTALTG